MKRQSNEFVSMLCLIVTVGSQITDVIAEFPSTFDLDQYSSVLLEYRVVSNQTVSPN
jgi:hypothetical protein